jgi:outer membrane protein assembly factor BamB
MKRLSLLSTCLLLLLEGCAQQSENSESAIMFRGDPQHTGAYINSGPEKLDEVKWKFKTDGRVFSSPALHNGTLFFGSNDDYLYAVDEETGSLAWKFKTGGDVSSSPAVYDGKVFFNSFDGKFYALDVKDGHEVWSFETGGEKYLAHKGLFGWTPADKLLEDPWDFFISSPVIENGIVYFGSGDSFIYALDPESGSLKWKYKTGNSVHSTPAVNDGILYCGSWDSYLYALDAKTGAEIWTVNTGLDTTYHLMEGIQSSPALSGGMVFVGTRSSYVMAFDAKTGEKIWEYLHPAGSWVSAAPSVYNGLVCVGTSDGKSFMVFDAKTGELKSEFKTNSWVFSSSAITGGIAYFGSHNGRFYSLNVETGELIAQYQTEASRQNYGTYFKEDGEIIREPFGVADMSNTHAYMVSFVDKILSVGSILSSPAVNNGVVFFGCADGYLYALK